MLENAFTIRYATTLCEFRRVSDATVWLKKLGVGSLSLVAW
jgi:hypothetical protein